MSEWLLGAWEAYGQAVIDGTLTLVIFVLAVVVGWVLARLLRAWAERAAVGAGAGRASLIGRVVAYGVFIVVVLGTLYATGAPVSGLMTWVAGAAGIAGVALGFASQTSAANIISGIFLIGERPFEEGDFIELAGVTGVVLGVDLLSTRMRTFDNTFVRMPNETVMRSTIVNLSRFPVRRIDVTLRLRPGVDLDTMKRLTEEVALVDRQVLVEPAPNVLFSAVTEGGVDLKFTAWTAREGYADTKARFAIALIARLVADGHELVGSRRELRQGDEVPPPAARPEIGTG